MEWISSKAVFQALTSMREPFNAWSKSTESSHRDPTKAGKIDLSRRRKECGGHRMKLTEDIAKLLIELNDKNWGKLSYKRLAGKLSEHGHSVATETVRTWCKELGAVQRRRYIKPKLTLQQKHNRLQWVIGEYNKTKRKFGDNFDTCHGDEKWFYLMRDGTTCRVFPQYKEVPGRSRGERSGDASCLQLCTTSPACHV